MGQQLLVFIVKEASVSIRGMEATWMHFHRAVQEEEKEVQRWDFGGLLRWTWAKKKNWAAGLLSISSISCAFFGFVSLNSPRKQQGKDGAILGKGGSRNYFQNI
jgi:hypothetical protein